MKNYTATINQNVRITARVTNQATDGSKPVPAAYSLKVQGPGFFVDQSLTLDMAAQESRDVAITFNTGESYRAGFIHAQLLAADGTLQGEAEASLNVLPPGFPPPPEQPAPGTPLPTIPQEWMWMVDTFMAGPLYYTYEQAVLATAAHIAQYEAIFQGVAILGHDVPAVMASGQEIQVTMTFTLPGSLDKYWVVSLVLRGPGGFNYGSVPLFNAGLAPAGKYSFANHDLAPVATTYRLTGNRVSVLQAGPWGKAPLEPGVYRLLATVGYWTIYGDTGDTVGWPADIKAMQLGEVTIT